MAAMMKPMQRMLATQQQSGQIKSGGGGGSGILGGAMATQAAGNRAQTEGGANADAAASQGSSLIKSLFGWGFAFGLGLIGFAGYRYSSDDVRDMLKRHGDSIPSGAAQAVR